MKSSFLIVVSIIAVSIACTAYKSAGSQPVANNNSVNKNNDSATAPGQEQEKVPCTLTLAGAPNIDGLRVGMTTDEVLALFPGSKNDPEVRAELEHPPSRFGTSSFTLTPGKYESKDKFAGINQAMFRLLDGRVSSVRLSYNGPAYSHVDSFVTKLAEEASLPKSDQWEAYVGMDNQLKTLKCAEFEVQAFVGGQGGNLNYVDIKDLLAEKKLQDRRAKARAAATPTP
jgi:hypothetical protein